MGSSSYPVFYKCSKLSTLNIGENVTNIPDYAFYDCDGLTAIIFPSSVANIGQEAFAQNDNLANITCLGSVPPVCENNVFSETLYYVSNLYVPQNSIASYQNANVWKEFYLINEIANVEKLYNSEVLYEIERYNINGEILTKPTYGINIVKYSNGTIKKEYVKH